jgi:hypothetical protein
MGMEKNPGSNTWGGQPFHWQDKAHAAPKATAILAQ